MDQFARRKNRYLDGSHLGGPSLRLYLQVKPPNEHILGYLGIITFLALHFSFVFGSPCSIGCKLLDESKVARSFDLKQVDIQYRVGKEVLLYRIAFS